MRLRGCVQSGTGILPVGLCGVGRMPMIHGLQAHAMQIGVVDCRARRWMAAASGVFGACRWFGPSAIGKACAKPTALPLPPVALDQPQAKASLGGIVKRSLRSLAMADFPCAGPSPRPTGLAAATLFTHPLKPWRCHPNREIPKWNRHDSSSFFPAILTSSGFPPAPAAVVLAVSARRLDGATRIEKLLLGGCMRR